MTRQENQAETATPVAAILFVFGAGLMFSFLDTGAKYLVLAGMSAPFVAWVRFAVHAVLAAILFKAWNNPARLRTRNLPMQLLRGVFLFGSTFFNFLALDTLQLAQTMSIFFFAPMVITALAGPLLGEWAGWRRWLAVGVGFVGVLVITRPGVSSFGVGYVYAFTATLSYCFYVIMTRHMSSTETSESLILYSALAPVILILPALPFSASLPPDAFHWLILILLGVFGGFGHWLLIKAYKLATTTALAPYPYLQMLWMISFGWLIFDQLPDRWTLIGGAIIVASGLYIVHREHRLRLKNSAAPTAEDEALAKKL